MMRTSGYRVYEERRNDGHDPADEYSVFQVQKPSGAVIGEWNVMATYETEEEADAHIKGILVARHGPSIMDAPSPPAPPPEWPMKTTPEAYLKRNPEGPNAALAREILGL